MTSSRCTMYTPWLFFPVFSLLCLNYMFHLIIWVYNFENNIPDFLLSAGFPYLTILIHGYIGNYEAICNFWWEKEEKVITKTLRKKKKIRVSFHSWTRHKKFYSWHRLRVTLISEKSDRKCASERTNIFPEKRHYVIAYLSCGSYFTTQRWRTHLQNTWTK